MFYVYSITNKVNGKAYIGFTKRHPDVRLYEHLYAASVNTGCRVLTSAIQKYGQENFDHRVEAEFESEQEALVHETTLIRERNTQSPNGYNITPGGEGGSGPHSNTTKRKIGDKHARSYRVTYPDGGEQIVTNLSAFCREHKLSIPCMMRTNKKITRKYRDRINKYKGYSCERI